MATRTLSYKARIDYTITDVSKTTYSFPFVYLKKKFIQVYIRNAEGNVHTLTYGKDYTVDNQEVTILTTSLLALNHTLSIRRETTTDSIVTWNDGSVLLAADMTLEQVQLLHLQEEQQDYLEANTISVVETENGNFFNANNLSISNVADPTEAQDVVTKHYMESVQDGFVQRNQKIEANVKSMQTDVSDKHQQTLASQTAAANSANLSKAWAVSTETPDDTADMESTTGKTQSSRTWALLSKVKSQEANTSATNAKASEKNAKTSETNANTSKQEAATSATNAKASEKNAKVSETNAKTSETNAKTSETNSEISHQLAKKWAEATDSPDGVVDAESPTGYTQSAKIWATLSKEYAGLSKFKLPIGYYNSVDEMRKSETAIVGRPCVTLGYYESNDGGGGVYIIRQKKENDTDDGGSVIFLDNGNVAEMFADGDINVKQFGATGDGTTDDTSAFKSALAYAKSKSLYVPEGTYIITENLFADSVVNVTDLGTYINIKPVYPPTDKTLLAIENMELLDSVSLGDEGYQGFCYNSSLDQFVCAGKKTDDSQQTLYILNPEDFSVIRSRKYTELAHANTLTYNPDNHKIYCLYDSNMIAVINEETLDIERTFRKNDGLTGLAYDPVTKLYVGFGYWGNNDNCYFYIYNTNFELLRKIKYDTQRTTNGLCMYNGTIIALFIGEIHEFSILGGLRKVLKYDDKIELEDVCMKDKTLFFNSNRMGTCTFFSLSSCLSAERILYKNREILTNIDLNNLMIDGVYKTLISKSEEWEKYHFPEQSFSLHVIVNSVNTREHIVQTAYRISIADKNHVFYRIYQDGGWTSWFTLPKFVDESHPYYIGTWLGSGFITGDRTKVYVTIPCTAHFPAQLTTVSINGVVTIRQNNDYIVTNMSLADAKVTKTGVGINVEISIPVKNTTINNDSCGIEINELVVNVS